MLPPLRRSSTLRHVLGLLAAIALAAAPAGAESVREAATRAKAAFQAKDRRTLRALADRSDPDPWLVADQLLREGEAEAAAAFASAGKGPATRGLSAYLRRTKDRRPDPARAQAAW